MKAECIFAAGLEEEDEEDLAFWDITNGDTIHLLPNCHHFLLSFAAFPHTLATIAFSNSLLLALKRSKRSRVMT